MQDIVGKAKTSLLVTFFYGPQHMDVSVLANQQELICFSSLWT